MNRTVIAGYVRTPFAFARKGPFHATRPDDLAAVALAELVRRSGIDPHLIEDVLMGCAYPEGAQGDNVARIASLLAGLPVQIGAATVNRFCGSSMYAIHMAAGQIAIGAGEAFIAAGVESMTMVPQGGLSAFRIRVSRRENIPMQTFRPRRTRQWASLPKTWRHAGLFRVSNKTRSPSSLSARRHVRKPKVVWTMNSCRLSRPMAPWSIAIFVCVRRLRSKGSLR